jgi:hypothetical protein
LLLLGCEFDEHATLEELVIAAAESDGIDWAVWGEEGFDVKLCGWLLLSEPFSVNATSHGLVFEHLDDSGVVSILNGLRERNLAAHGSIVVSQVKGLRRLEGLDDGTEGLETAPALERV